MPTLTVAGHDVTVGDDFLKLSPEDQQSMVNHIAQHLPAEKSEEPSGVIAGFQHGAADVARGDASTIGLTGAPTSALDAIASNTDAKNYKPASLIKEGGHWYNPSDYQPSALPQILAEQAPGLAQDASAGYVAGKLAPGGPAIKALAGAGGFAGSALLRTFGPGAHANADARTGVPNSPVETKDLTREGAKQAIELPLNMIGGSRILPTSKLAGSALEKYLKTVAIETGTGAANDVVDQAATTAGSKDGLNVDLNRTATSALTRAAGSGLLVAPKLASETSNNIKYGKFEGDADTQLAAQALARRQLGIADGRPLVGPLGGTKVAAEAVNGAHTDVHSELADATKNEALSQDNTNTLSRINKGDAVTPKEVSALADEASPETMHLARQAVISRQVRASGNVGDNSFTGGISGAMDNLSPIKAPIKATLATGAAALAGHAAGMSTLGAVAAPVLAGTFGAYGLARLADKLSGARSPAQGFTDRFGGTDAPTRLEAPAAPVPEPLTTSVPQVAPPQDTALWGNTADKQPSLRATLNSNVRVDEGMAKIAKQIAAQKKQSMISDAMPALQALAARQKAAAAQAQDAPAAPPPEAPAFTMSPIARKMLQQKLKQGLPPDPAPEAPPAAPAVPNLGIGPIQRRMLQAKMKQGLPDASPASPQIAEAMQTVASHAAPPAPVAAPAAPEAPAPAAPPTSMADILARAQAAQAVPPAPPVIAKITKKMGKPVEEKPHATEESAYTPMDADQLWGKGIANDKKFAELEASKMSDLKYPERYMDGVVRDRQKRRGIATDILGDNPSEADQQHTADLLEELHHTRRRDKAHGAIGHFTAKMSPTLKAAFRKRMDKSFVNDMWSK